MKKCADCGASASAVEIHEGVPLCLSCAQTRYKWDAVEFSDDDKDVLKSRIVEAFEKDFVSMVSTLAAAGIIEIADLI